MEISAEQSPLHHSYSQNRPISPIFAHHPNFFSPPKKATLNQTKKHASRKKRHGVWSALEEQCFLQFIKRKKLILEDKQMRRSLMIFKEMATWVLTRSSEQCRTHYQKYEMKFQEFNKIIAYVQGKIIDFGRLEDKILEDSSYEFCNEVDGPYKNNPVYTEKKQKKKIQSSRSVLNKKDQNKIPIEMEYELVKEEKGKWRLGKREINEFKIWADCDCQI